MNIFERLIATIAPHNCIICASEGEVLCDGCLYARLELHGSRCYICHKLTRQYAVCPACRRKSKLKHAWIASDYDDTAKMLLHKLKFERASAAAKPVAKAIDEVLPELPEDTLLCPIPTANARVRRRGYDQAVEIGKEIAKLRQLKLVNYLKRTGRTRQVGSKRTDRFKQLEGAFVVKRSGDPSGRRILLIDDVMTTGATAESAAKTLKDAGATKIELAVFAQP